MLDDRIGGMGEDDVRDIVDDVLYVDDANAAEDDDVTVSVWTSIVTGAHDAFRMACGRRGYGRRGGPDGTGAG